MLIAFSAFLLFLVLASAFFSGAETALTRLSVIKVKHWIYTRSAHSEAWVNWLSSPQELITAILVGNTLVNIFFSSLSTLAAINLFPNLKETTVEALAGGFAFVVLLVFGDIVPKIYCRHNQERVSSIALGPLYRMSKVLGAPVNYFLKFLGKFLPIFTQAPPARVSTLSLDEIRTILLDPASLQGLDHEHQEMMRRVLEMHKTSVSEIMTPWDQVDFLALDEAFSGEAKLERFVDRWVENGRTRVPVVLQKKDSPMPEIVGYLYVKDLLASVAQNLKITPGIVQRWVRKLPSLTANRAIGDVLDILRFGSPIACVRDESGFPIGIVTLEDVLEEFVGDILDEYDLEEKEGQR